MRFANDRQRKAVMASLRRIPCVRKNVMSRVIKTKDRRLSKLMSNPIRKLEGKQVIIRGKRWFDAANGNTYHSTEVYVDGKLIGKVPFAYGYENQYYETGKEILADKGFIDYERTDRNIPVMQKGKISYYTPKESINKRDAFSAFEDWRRGENRDKVTVFVDDVKRKRDL